MTFIYKSIWVALFFFCCLIPGYSQESVSQLEDIIDELYDDEKYEEVILYAEKLLALDPENVDAYMIGGLAYKKTNNFLKTIEYFTKAAEISPSGSTLNNLGGIYGELGFAYIALTKFEECFKHNSLKANAFMNRGLLLSNYQKYDEALTNIQQAIEIDPENPLYYLGIGGVYEELGDEEKHEAYFRKGLEYAPNMPEFNIYFTEKNESLQDSLTTAESYNKIVDTLTKRIEKNKFDAESFLLRAQIYNKLGKYELADDDNKQAINILSRVVKDIPDSWTMLCERGKAYFRLKDYENARKDFDKTLIFNPFYKKAIDLLKEINAIENK